MLMIEDLFFGKTDLTRNNLISRPAQMSVTDARPFRPTQSTFFQQVKY
jgi:hypothetical protein